MSVCSSTCFVTKNFDNGYKRKAADVPIYIGGKRIKTEIDEYEELPEPDFSKIITENLVIHLMERVRELETALYGESSQDRLNEAFVYDNRCDDTTVPEKSVDEIALLSDHGDDTDVNGNDAVCSLATEAEEEPQELVDSEVEDIGNHQVVVQEEDEKLTRFVEETLEEREEEQEDVAEKSVEDNREDNETEDNAKNDDKSEFKIKEENEEDDQKNGVDMPLKSEKPCSSFVGDFTTDSESDLEGETIVLNRNLKPEPSEYSESSEKPGLLQNLGRFLFRK
ncbi:unnamed protein product [Bursaphelenchus xylophilus]|uniref:(pine wood nematode) hypothetical protein n=1 Tax=Bursaphelenchus xylophilus TaxID=6326 RepID=A0A1I7RVY2_BURXY|nr:unnamed protein product [Bursaphelenchus xylophilus]CAG9094871.1 unnamed protein product [Bursaphelenchus xylophilus]